VHHPIHPDAPNPFHADAPNPFHPDDAHHAGVSRPVRHQRAQAGRVCRRVGPDQGPGGYAPRGRHLPQHPVKANVLGIQLNLPINLSLILNYCGKNVPSGFQC